MYYIFFLLKDCLESASISESPVISGIQPPPQKAISSSDQVQRSPVFTGLQTLQKAVGDSTLDTTDFSLPDDFSVARDLTIPDNIDIIECLREADIKPVVVCGPTIVPTWKPGNPGNPENRPGDKIQPENRGQTENEIPTENDKGRPEKKKKSENKSKLENPSRSTTPPSGGSLESAERRSDSTDADGNLGALGPKCLLSTSVPVKTSLSNASIFTVNDDSFQGAEEDMEEGEEEEEQEEEEEMNGEENGAAEEEEEEDDTMDDMDDIGNEEKEWFYSKENTKKSDVFANGATFGVIGNQSIRGSFDSTRSQFRARNGFLDLSIDVVENHGFLDLSSDVFAASNLNTSGSADEEDVLTM